MDMAPYFLIVVMQEPTDTTRDLIVTLLDCRGTGVDGRGAGAGLDGHSVENPLENKLTI